MSKPIQITCDQFFERQGLRMHYRDVGQGSPVVMVHGNPSWSFYYRNLIARLQAQHRCIVPDHIGCGLSDKPGDDQYTYTLQNRIDDLEALLDHLEITENITLVMHDWGGAIAMGYATRHPERISKLVILNTAAFHLPSVKNQIPLALRFARNTRLGGWLIENANAFSVGASWVGCKTNPMSANLRKAYQYPYQQAGQRIATLRFVQDIPLTADDPAYQVLSQIEDRLPELAHLPTLICWGMKDFVFDADFLAVWETLFPDADVYRFYSAGHYVLEDAAEDILPLVQEFLAPPKAAVSSR